MDEYNKHNNWLVIGKKENWLTAFSQPVPLWGLRDKYKNLFNMVETGDIIWCYVTYPISGIIGIGHIIDKYIDDKTLIWPQEIEQNKAIWIYKFRFKLLKIISPDFNLWEKNNIKISDFNLNWQIGFQLLSEKLIVELIRRSENLLIHNNSIDSIYQGPSVIKPVMGETVQRYEPSFTHNDIKSKVAEIGKLQHFYTEFEYSIPLKMERKSLDVVWKRELQGVPTYTFEIELSGNIEKAIERLKYAYRIWNAKPRLITFKEQKHKVENLIGIEKNTSFYKDFKLIFPDQIEILYSKKRELRDYEASLGIYDIY